jgi:hypothetical protein
VVKSLTAYESAQVAEIAAWKAEAPGPIARLWQGVRGPLGRVVGKAVPASMVRKLAEKAEALVEHHDGLDQTAREAGVEDIEELRYRTLEESDRLAKAVSARAQWLALVEGAAAGVGGLITELGNIPVLLAAAERAIRRIGHCYGYRLESEADRRFVLGVLELSTLDDFDERRALRDGLEALATSGPGGLPGSVLSLNGVKKEVVEELALEAVPVLGDVASVALDYAFMRRVDVTARRVFQERWLRDRGKLTAPIPPAEAHPLVRARPAALELVTQAAYLGGFGVGFVMTAPVALAAALASRLPAPMVLGASDGARDAVASADRFSAGWRSLASPDSLTPARPAELTA